MNLKNILAGVGVLALIYVFGNVIIQIVHVIQQSGAPIQR